MLTVKNVPLQGVNALISDRISSTDSKYRSVEKVDNVEENKLHYLVEMLNKLTVGFAFSNFTLISKRGLFQCSCGTFTVLTGSSMVHGTLCSK